MDFQKVHGWPRPVRIRLQGSEPGTVCQSFLGIKTPHRTKRCGKLVDLEGFEPLTSRMRTERSPSNIAFVHTLCTARKAKSTYIRPYKTTCHPNGLPWSQVWFPICWFSRWSNLGRNMVGGQVSYRPLRCNSHGVQMYHISIHNKIRCAVKAQLLLLINGRCAFYIWQQVIDWQEYAYTINFI